MKQRERETESAGKVEKNEEVSREILKCVQDRRLSPFAYMPEMTTIGASRRDKKNKEERRRRRWQRKMEDENTTTKKKKQKE